MQAVLDESAELLRAVRRHVHLRDPPRLRVRQRRRGPVERVGSGGELVLLPEDPDRSAARLRAGIEAALGVRPAVVIADSFGRAWRLGQTDVAIGVAGLSPLDQWIGRPDGFGRDLRVTSIAVADSAAAAADLARAKDSLEPVVLLRGLDRFVTAEDGPGAAALRRPADQDLFR